MSCPAARAPRLLREPGAILERILRNWPGPSAGEDRRRQLVTALAAWRLYPEEALLAVRRLRAERMESCPEIEDIVDSARFCRRFELAINEYSRLRSLGQAGTGELEQTLNEQARLAGNLFDREHPRSDAGFLELVELIGQKFHARVRRTDRDVYFGHVIEEDRLPVEQYGRKGPVPCSNRDQFVTIGYFNWFWDSSPIPAGYAAAGEIRQIRPWLAGNARRIAFIEEYERLRFEGDFPAHEGRHAPDPAGHGNEIEGLDPLRPLLPQFDKLKDGQVRELFRPLDPWAPRAAQVH